MRLRCWVAAVSFGFVLCSISQFALGQSVYGSIQGTLTDAANNPIAGAKVTISSIGKGIKFTKETDSTGLFLVTGVPPDDYRLRAEAAGFKTSENPGVTVYADNLTNVNIKLAKGASTEIVPSTAADVSVLKIDRTDVSTILTQSQITDLPLLQQNISDLQVLVPGAIPETSSLPVVQNPQQGPFININGQDFSGDAYQLDGTDNRDALEGIVVINPNQDAVQEMKITTQNYSAEFGEATAGVVTAQTKSGSNTLHGTVFGYRQSGWGEASYPDYTTVVSYSSAPVPPEITGETLKRNQFGGSLGGALIKNKLFFFVDYRGERDVSGATLNLTVPTLNVRNTCGVTGIMDCDLSDYNVALKNGTLPAVVVDPANNMALLNSEVSPQMVALLNLLPMPTNTTAGVVTNNYQVSGGEPLNSDNSDLRLDYDVHNLKLFARYTYDSFRQTGAPAFGVLAGGPGTNPDLFAGRAATPNQGAALGFSYTFSPQLSTDFRFGYLRYHLDMNAPDFGSNTAYDNGGPNGIIGLNDPSDVYASDLPDIQLTNSIALGTSSTPVPPSNGQFLRFGYSSGANNCNCPLREHEQQFQFVDNWTRLAGHHTFRFGGDFRYIENFRLQSAFPGVGSARSGFLQFSDDTFTNLALGDFLVGAMAFFDRTYSDPTVAAAFNAQERQKRLFSYGQDTWRVSPRLTLNYGLRWEIYFPQSVNQTNAGGFLLVNNNLLSSLADTSVNVAGENGVNLQGNVKNTFKNFGPRVGFAYLAGAKTVIRGGYGRSFDVGYAGSLFGIAATQNPPVEGMLTVNNGSGINHSATCNGGPCPPFILNSNITGSSPVNASYYTTTSFSGFETNPSLLNLCTNFIANQNSTGNVCSVSQTGTANVPQEGATLFALPSRLRVPTVDAWNLTIQHEFAPSTFVELAYVANKGTHVLTDTNPYYDLNAPSQNVITPIANTPTGTCTGNYKQIGSGLNYCANQEWILTPLQPWVYPVYYFGNNSSNNYNSLQAKFSRNFKGVNFLAHYTYSKILDYDSSYFAVNPGVSYGPGDYDRRHSIAAAAVWALPIGRNRAIGGNMGRAADSILGGWSLTTITTWYSGLPFSPEYRGGDCVTDLRSESFADPPCIANRVGPVTILGNRSQYFTTTSGAALTTANGYLCGIDANGNPAPGPSIGPWQRPGCGQIGNAGRNSLRGPDFFDGDFSLIKEISVTDRVALRLRADAFNLFNKVNLGMPNPVVDAATQAGAITASAPGAVQRQFEFSAKVIF
jgi:hypothetical protein